MMEIALTQQTVGVLPPGLTVGTDQSDFWGALQALTLIQPMASAIVADRPDAKRIENRPRSMPKHMIGVRTTVALHAGAKWSADYVHSIRQIFGPQWDMEAARALGGNILGLMEFSGRQFTTQDPGPDPWFAGPWGYQISRVAVLREPIPCRGALGWWPVPANITQKIWAQDPEWTM